jgi:serine/threonine protein kinase
LGLPRKFRTSPGLFAVRPITSLLRLLAPRATIRVSIGKSFLELRNSESMLTISNRWSLGILIFEMLCGFTPFWDAGSPLKIYENILKGRVKYPPYIHPDAQDLLTKLITHDLTKRLGNLHGGSRDVMNHAWFAEVTWERLAKKDIDAPYVPPVKGGIGDASLFDKYPEETEQYGQPGDDP